MDSSQASNASSTSSGAGNSAQSSATPTSQSPTPTKAKAAPKPLPKNRAPDDERHAAPTAHEQQLSGRRGAPGDGYPRCSARSSRPMRYAALPRRAASYRRTSGTAIPSATSASSSPTAAPRSPRRAVRAWNARTDGESRPAGPRRGPARRRLVEPAEDPQRAAVLHRGTCAATLPRGPPPSPPRSIRAPSAPRPRCRTSLRPRRAPRRPPGARRATRGRRRSSAACSRDRGGRRSGG